MYVILVGRYVCTPGHDVHRSFMLYALVGTVVALLRSDLLHSVMHRRHQHQTLLPFEICRPSTPAAEGGRRGGEGGGGEGGNGGGNGDGAYGVAQFVPPDAQARKLSQFTPLPLVVLPSNSFHHHADVTRFSSLQFVCMAVLTAVDMGTRSFILHLPAHVDASAAANVLVKAGGLDVPPSGQSQIGLTSSPLASSMPPLRASPYETGLCVDKGSAGSSAGVLFCWLRVFLPTPL